MCENVDIPMASTTANPYRSAAVFRAELRRFLRVSEDCARKYGLTPRQHVLLLQIAGSENETLTVSELVQLLALTQSAVTELVQRAEEAGLVARTPSPHDGRVSDLRLTPEGEQRLSDVHRALGPERERLHAMLEALDAE
jgi:DNA-binding MarR family transcriptional regulator